jgi:outer membrane protein assembly factor BamB
MKTTYTCATVLVLLICASSLVMRPLRAQSVVTFIEATANDAVRHDYFREGVFSFSVGDYRYKVSGTGWLTAQRLNAPSQESRRVPLDFPSPGLISGVRQCSYKGDLIICYDILLLDRPIEQGSRVVSGDVVQGRISRLDSGTLKTKWTVVSAPTNPGVPIVADNSVYVSGTYCIGEVDLDTGYYLWRHDDLDVMGGKFVAFKVPRVQGEYVFYEEDESFTRSRTRATIQVKRRSGEIITMDYKPVGK